MSRAEYKFDLELAVTTWRRRYSWSRVISDADVDELERHVRDHVAFLVDTGRSSEDAFKEVIKELGQAPDAESEFKKIYWGKLRQHAGITQELSWRISMLSNYLKVTFRSLVKHRSYAAVNLLGLTVGIVSCLVIFLVVQHELSYDRFHPDAENIYRVNTIFGGEFNNALTGAPVGPALQAASADVDQMVRFYPSGRRLLLEVGDRRLYSEDGRFIYADSAAFQMFDFGLIAGDPEAALVEPNSLVLTESSASRLFGLENPVGQIVRVDNNVDYVVTGVMQDVPPNAHFHFDFLASWNQVETIFGEGLTNWGWNPFFTFVRVADQAAATRLASLFPQIVADQAGGNFGECCELQLQPLTEIHLDPKGNEMETASSMTYVRLLIAIASLILLIACFNFINLATARASTRVKEISMRKVAGAKRSQLITQFVGEALLMATGATVLAVCLVFAVLPTVGQMVGKELSLVPDAALVLTVLSLVLIIGVLAGMYPAIAMSRFNPIEMFRGGKSGSSRQRLRGTLVVFQFAVSVALIVSTIIVFKQLDFMHHSALGLESEQIVAVPMPTANDDASVDAELLRTRLLDVPGVTSVGYASRKPGTGAAGTGMRRVDWSSDDRIGTKYTIISHEYLETMQIPLAGGRGFSREFPTDEDGAVVINRQAMEEFGWATPEEAVGDYLVYAGDRRVQVIGVTENFHFQSFRVHMQPLALFLAPQGSRHLFLRVDTPDVTTAIAGIEAIWDEHLPNWPLAYTFLDEDYQSLYVNEERFGSVFGLFTLIALFIACLGLFGLAAFSAERRTKEMGIRKALGASTGQIVQLMSREMAKLVVIANLIAWPLAWYAAQRWLETYPFRTSLALWVFVVGSLAALAIAWFSISFQAVRASKSDPATSLRYE